MHRWGLILAATLTLTIPDERLLEELDRFCHPYACEKDGAETKLRSAVDIAIHVASRGERKNLDAVGGTLDIRWDVP